ncbi:CPBP family intramembrane glutamic endopeptidase [Methanobacterium sp.]|uniref:CPBP family intramembrane glutamic endopeptidase n=1 Tax=Methanobacterium sp. TaxID=2164 RepID=UPI002AB92B67|nr:CPBP family intramembrane glutamic endopeptidase [Methanobacterium sp.]MDY9923619.1 CPBP family intramembrane glutamic endopeptidase [Methanobacterium sp.]
MKLNINWKLFLILFVASIIASLLVLPYALALSPALASVFTPVVLIAQLIQSIILFAIAILVGLTLYKRVGFKMPILEGWLEGKEVGNYLKSILGISVGLGVLAGILIIIFSFLFTSASSVLQGAELTVPLWKSFLASFYGGIGEEILFRLFVMTVIVWIFYKIKKTPEGKPTTIGISLAIIITAILFGIGHLPITGSIIAITPLVIARAIVLNGIGAIIFGWLYWKKGLESAMISHFSADIVLHVLFPLILSSFIL